MRKHFTAFSLAAGLAVLGASLVFSDIASVKAASASSTCDLSAGSVWVPARMPPHRVDSFSHGPGCDKAAVMLTVRAPNGTVLWVDAMPASQVMTFAGITSAKDMKGALADWLRQSAPFKTSADLPPWRPGASSPVNGEFPFYPAEGVDRDFYEKTRASRVPVFCYVQGMESLSCIVLQDGSMTKLGVQSFPG